MISTTPNTGFGLTGNFQHFAISDQHLPEIKSAFSQISQLLLRLTYSIKIICTPTAQRVCDMCSRQGREQGVCQESSSSSTDSRVPDQLLYSDWLVSMNHFRHLLDITPIWKMSSVFNETATRTPGTTLCTQAKCWTCPFICTAINICGPKSQMNITKQLIQTPDVQLVFIIYFTKCAQLYVSKTRHTLNSYFKEHFADIKHQKD